MTEKTIFLTAILLLLAGFFIYLVFRPASIFYTGLHGFSCFKLHGFQQAMLNSLPSFFHTISFILISSVFIERTGKGIFFISLFWILLESIFELGQGIHFTEINGFSAVSFIIDYFNCGVLDINDIFAIISGGILSFLILCNFKIVKD